MWLTIFSDLRFSAFKKSSFQKWLVNCLKKRNFDTIKVFNETTKVDQK